MWSDIKNTIVNQLQTNFSAKPHYFFTEHDIHSVLYDLTKKHLQRFKALTETTSDKFETTLVHHEYPTPFRCKMQGYEFQPTSETERTQKGGLYRRGHYDLVILNPDFVKNHTLNIVRGKNYKEFQSIMAKLSTIPLIWACEIIYFPKTKQLPENAIKTIKQDTLKIKETKNRNFCKMGSVHVFTGHPSSLAIQLKQQIREFAEREQIEVTLTTA